MVLMPKNQLVKSMKRPKTPREEFIRAEKWLRENLLAQALLERSNLDKNMLKTMLLHYWADKVTFEELANQLGIQRPGAWKRWRKGRDIIMRSFYTLELAIYSGILETEIAEILADDLQDYISLAKEEADLEELRDRIEERMVRLAKLTPKDKSPTP